MVIVMIMMVIIVLLYSMLSPAIRYYGGERLAPLIYTDNCSCTSAFWCQWLTFDINLPEIPRVRIHSHALTLHTHVLSYCHSHSTRSHSHSPTHSHTHSQSHSLTLPLTLTLSNSLKHYTHEYYSVSLTCWLQEARLCMTFYACRGVDEGLLSTVGDFFYGQQLSEKIPLGCVL